MPRDWSPKARAKQRAVIMKTKPWLKATGPKTKRGKRISSQNSRKPADLYMWWDCDDPAEQKRIWRRIFRPSQAKL